MLPVEEVVAASAVDGLKQTCLNWACSSGMEGGASIVEAGDVFAKGGNAVGVAKTGDECCSSCSCRLWC